MRGKERYSATRKPGSRITPACAGKRVRCSQQALPRTDHPRMCGEKSKTKDTAAYTPGSPPRMRGKGVKHRDGRVRVGITPAYAGKSTDGLESDWRTRDHPRVCGEKLPAFGTPIWQGGSPPHVRGKDFIPCRCPVSTGITPACAGKRLKRSRSTVPPVAIVPLFPSVCNKPVVSDGSPAGRDAPLFLPAENAVPASPAYNLRSL